MVESSNNVQMSVNDFSRIIQNRKDLYEAV
jgi:hypothetical protein